MKFATSLAALTVAIASTFAAGSAFAAQEQETFSSNPSGRCQPATVASESLIRKRPLAMVNEGSTPAFVNCAFEMEINQSLLQLVTVYVSNSTAADSSVTCTAISGWEGRTTNEYLPVTQVIPAGEQGPPFQWFSDDFANGSGGLISVQCQLQPGTAINDTYVDLLVEDNDTPPAP